MTGRRLRRNPVTAALVWLTFLFAGTALAQGGASGADAPRFALVIGNAGYETLPRLPTSVNDARDVAEALEALGFQVTTEVDATLQTMRDALARFLEQLRRSENRNAIAAFYFAGHGVHYARHNFMLPTDFDIDEGQDDLDERALWLDVHITREMSRTRAAGANVIMLEACREDPFGDEPGLALVDTEKNLPERSLIMFAAWSGEASVDKVDDKAPQRNAIFTNELLKHLKKVGPSMDLKGFFKVVQSKVKEVTQDEQQPRMMARLSGEPILLAKGAPRLGGSDDLALWQAVEKSADLCGFEHYLASYPSGAFVDQARAKARLIRSKNEALARNLRSLPASVAAKVKAEQAEYEARCTKKYGASSASRAKAIAAVHARNAWRSNPPALSPGMARGDADFSGGRRAMMADDSRLRGRFLMRVGMASGVERHEVRASLAGLLPTQAMSPPGDSEAVGDEEFRATLLEAEQGDVDAMYRVAVMYENGTNSVPKDTDAMLRWLVVSSALGNGLASYKLYRLYNAERRTLADAIRFKSLAKKQGYTGPPGLSLRR